MPGVHSRKGPTPTVVLVFSFLALAGCEDAPTSTADAAANQDPDASKGSGEVVADAEGGKSIPLDAAEVFFEFNTTDNDLGFQMFLDAEGWERIRLADASRKKIVDISAKAALSALGITELRFESAEPSPAEVLALFPPGTYTFTGRTVEGDRLASRATLSHDFLAAPMISPSGGEVVDPNATVVRWSAPGAAKVQIIIENEELGHFFDVIVSGSIATLNVPPQFLQAGTEYKIEILAMADNRNRTIVESTFVTAANTALSR